MASLEWWLNLAAFFGVAVLAVPVWSLNFRRKRLTELRRADRESATDLDFRAKARKIIIDRHNQNVGDWRPVDQHCLMVGYLLLFSSSLLRLLLAA